MGLTVGLGTAAGARRTFKATVYISLAVALPGERGKLLRLQRGVIAASVLRDMLLGPPVFRWQRTLAKNPLGVAPDMYTPKCAPQRAPCSGAAFLACFASARALGAGNSQVPPSCAPIILHKIKTKRSHTRNAPPLYSVFCALPFGVSLFTQLFVSFWESWCQVFCFFDQHFSAK